MKKSQGTLSEIARSVGVSITTVSDVLNRPAGRRYRAKTQERIRALAAEMGYVPSRSAQQLASGKSREIGVLLTRSFDNPYWAQVADRLESAIRSRGYRTQLAVADASRHDMAPSLRHFRAASIDGLLVGPLYEEADLEAIRNYLGSDVPIAILGRFFKGYDGISTDEFAAGSLAARHLLEQGHRRFAFLGAPFALRERAGGKFNGMLEALETAAVPFDDTWLFTSPDTGSFRAHYDAARRFCEQWRATRPGQRPTAVLCHNDQVAMTALCAFAQEGIAVPRDLSVVGADNLPESEYLVPPLTTVDFQVEAQAVHLVDALFQRLENPEAPLVRITIPPKLVERNSTTPPNNKEPHEHA